MTGSVNKDEGIQVDAWSSFADRYEKGIGGTTRYVAKRLIEQSPPFSSESVVLDNACGTGVVTEEIQAHLEAQSDIKVRVYAADAAPQMVQVLKSKAEQARNNATWPNIADLSTHVIPAEELDESIVPSSSVTHAYMNFGIFFCSDALKAAQHIHRVLKPGGTAFVTTWADLGYDGFMRETEKVCNPGNENFELPFAPEWHDPEYANILFPQAGFSKEKIKVFQQPSYFRAKDIEEMTTLHTELFGALIRGKEGFKDEESKMLWRKTLAENMVKDEHYLQEENGIAIKMLANVAICTK